MSYIQRRAFDDLPPDAIVLSEGEVLDRHIKTINNWKPAKEVWAFNFGPVLLGSVNLFATCSIAGYYRRRVKLPHSGLASYYSLTAGACGFFSTFVHRLYTQDDILLQRECTYCYFAKGAAAQICTFLVYGVFSSCFATAISAHTLNTYSAVAGFQSWADIKETVRLYAKFSQKISHKLVGFSALIGLSTCAIMFVEESQFHFVTERLREKDAQLRAVAAELQASRQKKTN